MRQEQLRFAKKNGMKIAATAFIPEGEGKHPVIIFTQICKYCSQICSMFNGRTRCDFEL